MVRFSKSPITQVVSWSFLFSLACVSLLSRSGEASAARHELSPRIETTVVRLDAQGCVDRWNDLRMSLYAPTVALVTDKPRCLIKFAYSYILTATAGCDPSPFWRRRLIGKSRICVATNRSFRCMLNDYGAYECPEHPNSLGVDVENATLAADEQLVLNRPTRSPGQTPVPPWAVRYPVDNGFIKPWSPSGKLRPDLKLLGGRRATCKYPSSAVADSKARLCVAAMGGNAWDPCFSRANGWQHRGTVAACSNEPGSRRFMRVVVA
jgi:hypothetical protein